MKVARTADQIRLAILERELAFLEGVFKAHKSAQINSLLKDLRDFGVDNLICIYIEAKLKNKKNHLPDYALASIEDLEDLIITHKQLEGLNLPF